MSKSFLLVALGICLLLECCQHVCAIPSSIKDASSSSEESGEKKNEITKKESNSNESGEEKEQADPRLDLLTFSLHELAVLANRSISEAKEVAKHVVEDVGSKKSKVPDLENHLKNFTDFIARVEKLPKSLDEAAVELFDLMSVFSNLTDRYNSSAAEQAKAEDLLFELSLEKNGVKKLDQDFSDRFKLFAENFEKRFQNYKIKSSPADQKSTAMREWYKEFQAETDVEKQVEKFGQFFDLFDSESD